MHPCGQNDGFPHDPAALDKKHSLGLGSSIVEHERLVGQANRCRSLQQRAEVRASDTRVRDVVAALCYAKTHPIDLQIRIAERHLNYGDSISGTFRTG